MKRIITIVFLGLVALVLLAANVVSIVKLTKVPDAIACFALSALIWLPGRVANISGLTKGEIGSIVSLIVGLLYHPLLALFYTYSHGYYVIPFLLVVSSVQVILHAGTHGERSSYY